MRPRQDSLIVCRKTRRLGVRIPPGPQSVMQLCLKIEKKVLTTFIRVRNGNDPANISM